MFNKNKERRKIPFNEIKKSQLIIIHDKKLFKHNANQKQHGKNPMSFTEGAIQISYDY